MRFAQDENALARADLHEAVLFQPYQRFTDRCAGDFQGIGQGALVEAQVGLDPQNPDLVSQVVAASAVALTAFEGSLERTVEHRVGTITARRMLGFRIIDELGHTWDVATATGQSPNLDTDALAIGTEIALMERTTLERSPNFATSPHDRETPVGDQLTVFLHAIGRVGNLGS